jgi:hypothetical protein
MKPQSRSYQIFQRIRSNITKRPIYCYMLMFSVLGKLARMPHLILYNQWSKLHMQWKNNNFRNKMVCRALKTLLVRMTEPMKQ